jgi:hypothetical protein
LNSEWINWAKSVALSSSTASKEIATILSEKGFMKQIESSIPPTAVVTCLEQFQECVRYLNTRRSKGAVINIASEEDVQDVVFLMLRPTLLDLISENPTDNIAGRYVIKDFLTKNINVVIEAKYIRDQKHGREITKELHDDIETYRNHPNCSYIIFFIYDRDALIPDIRALKRQIEGIRNYDGKQIQVFCVVKP